MKKEVIVKVSFLNWKMSHSKWEKIVEFVKSRKIFDNKMGFNTLQVIGKCGYCLEVELNCSKCYLYDENMCCSVEYLLQQKEKRNTPFWTYVTEMRHSLKKGVESVRWNIVLSSALKMRDIIKGDEPERASFF